MPVREALRALETEGLVKVTPFRGTVVTEHSAEDIREIYQIRMLLEGFAAEQAVRNITPESIAKFERILDGMKQRLSAADYRGYADYDRAFHHLIAESSGNRRLVKLIESTWRSFAPHIAYTISGRIERSYSEHTKIFDAIRRGKADVAARLCCEQIETVYKEMAPYFQGQHREE
jgi:DNA-binding GntR family transcriptional regulator